MTQTTSDESLEKLPEQKQAPLPKFSRRGWGLLLGGALPLAGGTWSILQLTRPPHSQEVVSLPKIAVETLTIRPQAIADTPALGESWKNPKRSSRSWLRISAQ